MTLLIFIWYLLGAAGSTLGTLSDLIDGNDFTVNDLIICLLISIAGPITLFLGLAAYLSNRKIDNRFNKTLIKGKK